MSVQPDLSSRPFQLTVERLMAASPQALFRAWTEQFDLSVRRGHQKLSENDQRPPVWVGHVVLETDRLEETAQFMRKIGMRPIVQRPDVAVLEMRGGTHLVLVAKPEVAASEAPFDLMVEDLQATRQNFIGMGLEPTPIERASFDHERFFLREPAGHLITFFSSHVSGRHV